MRFRYSYRKKAKLFANSGYPDQTPRSVASDLDLHCLPITCLGVSRLQWVNRWQIDDVFLNFLRKRVDISRKLSPLEKLCMKYQNLFSGKSKKNISILFLFTDIFAEQI